MSEIKVNSIKGVGASAAAITVNNTDGTCTANITNNLSNRNKVINGGMMIHQRGDASASGSAAYLSCDRFFTNNGSGSQVAVTKSTDTPDGFSASTKWDCTTADSSIAAGDYFIIQHRIEGQNVQDFAKGTTSAKQYALSFYIKATKTGVYTVELEDTDNARACSKTITVSDTNWNRYTIIYPADTTGAFNNDANSSLAINFWLIAGSNFTSGTFQTSAWGTRTTPNRVSSSQVNAMDSTSNDFYLTGVQLEVGSVATDFEHRSFGQELALCQRYYFQIAKGDNKVIGHTMFFTDTDMRTAIRYPVQMRTTPSVETSNSSGHFEVKSGSGSGSGTTDSSFATFGTSPPYADTNGIVLASSVSDNNLNGLIGYVVTGHADANLALTAEL